MDSTWLENSMFFGNWKCPQIGSTQSQISMWCKMARNLIGVDYFSLTGSREVTLKKSLPVKITYLEKLEHPHKNGLHENRGIKLFSQLQDKMSVFRQHPSKDRATQARPSLGR